MEFRPLLLFISMITFVQAQEIDWTRLDQLNIRNVGPANMSGRITAIAAVNENPNVLYVGAASGGVWKSENGGSTWEAIFNEQPTQNIGAIALQQSYPNIIWVGTGEGNPRNSMNLGMGIFKSLDGGITWEKILYTNEQSGIADLVMDPSNPNKLIAALYQHRRTPYYFTSGGHNCTAYREDRGKIRSPQSKRTNSTAKATVGCLASQ